MRWHGFSLFITSPFWPTFIEQSPCVMAGKRGQGHKGEVKETLQRELPSWCSQLSRVVNEEIGFKGRTMTPMTIWQMMAAECGRKDLFEPNLSGSRVRESVLKLSQGSQGHGPLVLKASLNDQWCWSPQWSAVFGFYHSLTPTQWLRITPMYYLTVSVGRKFKYGRVQSYGFIIQWQDWNQGIS